LQRSAAKFVLPQKIAKAESRFHNRGAELEQEVAEATETGRTGAESRRDRVQEDNGIREMEAEKPESLKFGKNRMSLL
jgi:hypothetical protein